MSESGDYVPAPHWKGHDFKTAKQAKTSVVGRSYGDAVSKGVGSQDCVPPSITTDAESCVVFGLDCTGSMGDWPGTIEGKFPYFESEGKEYLGDGMRVSFCFIGDAFSDKFPLQVRPFLDGADWAKVLGKTDKNGNPIPPPPGEEKELLILEGGGGGSGEESYDLAALYYARNCHMPDVIRKPIFIFIGDEGIYNFVDKQAAKEWAHCDLDGRMTPKQAFEELREKFSVYVIRKPYNSTSNNRSESEIKIQNQWEQLLGADHVVSLPNAERVVDVIFGILAKEEDRIEYFQQELADRQMKDVDGPEKIDIVMTSLKPAHATKAPTKSLKRDGKSISKSSGGPKSISLLDDSPDILDELGNF